MKEDDNLTEGVFTENGELNPELRKKIEDKVKELKAADAKLKKVFPILVEGEEGDEKDYYIGFFKQPNFTTFSKYISASQSNQAVAMRTLAKDCFVAGDKELVDDESLFLFGTMGQMGEIIKMRNSKLVNLSMPGK